MASLDEYLANLIGGSDPRGALENYLSQSAEEDQQRPQGIFPYPQENRSSTGQSAQSYSGPRPDYTPDENGYIHGRAATFATPTDLANYRQTGSLATGDNGVGAFGHNTTALPGVAIASNVLSGVYGSAQNANGKRVEVISPNGTSAVLPILDVGPHTNHAQNNSVLELTPAATQLLGSGDANGYKYRFLP
jgi:hypothetical protein